MQYVLLLIVVVIIGWLTVTNLKSQTAGVAQQAQQYGVQVSQSATPKQQVEAIGKAVEQMQQKEMDDKARQEEQAMQGR